MTREGARERAEARNGRGICPHCFASRTVVERGALRLTGLPWRVFWEGAFKFDLPPQQGRLLLELVERDVVTEFECLSSHADRDRLYASISRLRAAFRNSGLSVSISEGPSYSLVKQTIITEPLI